jgi:hypothetical protein
MFIGPERLDAVCGGSFELRPPQHTVLRVASHLLKIQSQSKQIIRSAVFTLLSFGPRYRFY